MSDGRFNEPGMARCRTCRALITSLASECEECLMRRFRQAILIQQKIMLEAYPDYELEVGRAKSGVLHIALIGDADHPYCGARNVTIVEPRNRRRRHRP